jgi:hypothetical protein
MSKVFENPNKNYNLNFLKLAKRPSSPNPESKRYEQLAKINSTKERCTYIHPESKKRCKLVLGIYPRFCYLHTLLVENLQIKKSQIKNAGNGLYAGPFGFKKGDQIGEYSMPWMKGQWKRILNRTNEPNTSYLLCVKKTCWDALDKNSTIIRNANDAHGSKFKNNAYFLEKNKRVYMVASKKIKPKEEIFCDYGEDYFI